MRTMEKLFEKIDKSDTNGCWNWTGAKAPGGYGQLEWFGKHYRAHRLVYELLVGHIPDGLVLDHLCRNSACVNPRHLEPVTTRINTLRGENFCAKKFLQTHCVNGHEFTDKNTWIRSNGVRQCRTCYHNRYLKRKYGEEYSLLPDRGYTVRVPASDRQDAIAKRFGKPFDIVIEDFRQSGSSWQEISKKVGIPYQTLIWWRAKNGNL